MFFRAVIIDDEERARTTLAHLLREYCPHTILVVGEAGTALHAKDIIVEQQPDVVFLDIELQECNGFDVLRLVREHHKNFSIIVVTGHQHYAIQALNEGALYYILKPIDPDDLMCAMDKLRRAHPPSNIMEEEVGIHEQNRRTSLYVRLTAGQESIIPFKNIMYCTSEGNYYRLHLSNAERIVSYGSIKKLLSVLPSYFLRIQSSCIANAHYIQKYMYNSKEASVALSDGTVLQLSRRYRGTLRKQLQNMGITAASLRTR